jgi:hypothetical protein
LQGDFPAAASLIAEAQSIAAATGTGFVPYGALMLAGFRGAEAEAAQLIEAVITDARAAGQGHGIQAAHRISAVLYNGLGRYETACTEARQAAEEEPGLNSATWALPELVEAASRSGQAGLAANALGQLAEATSIGQTDLGQGMYARCRALLSDGADADSSYREACERLSRTGYRTELARAHLLYGEWLRREGRRTDAREQLRTAHEMFDPIGMQAFAGRTRRELLSTGMTVRKRTVEPQVQLTPPGGADRAAGRVAGPVEHGDRLPAVPVHADRRMAPAQDIHQARHQLPPAAARRAGSAGARGPAGLAEKLRRPVNEIVTTPISMITAMISSASRKLPVTSAA